MKMAIVIGSIGGAIVAEVIVALIFSIMALNNSHSNYSSLKAVKACVYNPSYQGVTPEDSRQLFVQCLDDYKMAGR
jgi:hypothetical protein